ncbi:hypothetical protein PSE_3190 [Pseudovibrio sp. FO-BEG1]|nr:hypothetical protein PSE_3190 [Pseudovibrio sp. FO-BEG1]
MPTSVEWLYTLNSVMVISQSVFQKQLILQSEAENTKELHGEMV